VPVSFQRETRDACEAIVSGGAVRKVERGDHLLLLPPPLSPLLVTPVTLTNLSFDRKVARLAGLPGRLTFRLGSGSLPVRIESGMASSPSLLRIPLVGAGGLELRLDDLPPPGARVLDARRGVEIGIEAAGDVKEPPLPTAAPTPRTSSRSEPTRTP
jgi:hypothetical protein